jgi:hypothetical protein
MSGTRLDWISLGLADSVNHMLQQLIWWCNNTARSKGVQPCHACCFHPDSLPDTCEIMTDYTEEYLDLQTRQSIAGAITWDLKDHSLMRVGTLGHSPAKENGLGLSTVWLKDYGMAVDMRPQHPRTLSWVGKATATALGLCYGGALP